MRETEDNCDLSEQIPYCYDHFRKGKIPRIARIRQGRNHLLSVDPSPPDPLHYDRHPFDARRVGRFGAAGRLSGAGPHSGLAVPHSVDRLHRIIRDLGREGRPYTVDEVADRFCAQSCGVGVTAFMREQIAQLTADNRLGTARNYTRTLRSFSGFLGGGELPFAAFTERLVEEYNAYLLRRGVVRNTVSFYMRILRSVYNKAVRRRLAEPASPFGGVYTGVDRTRKRAIDERLIARLKSLDLPVSGALPLARDLFVFSYCMRGMAFVDMAFLRKKDMRDGAIRYVRRKTGQRMTVHLEPCMREIIGRYAPRTRDTPYLFPVLTAEDPARAYAQYQVALNYYNRLLKKLASLLGLDSGLSSYTSRHSWATAARNHNVPLPVISAGMGHTSERTTQIYLSALETSVIDSANRKILASLNRCVSC